VYYDGEREKQRKRKRERERERLFHMFPPNFVTENLAKHERYSKGE